MALVTCIDCGKDVSERARACPHCGAPMQADEPVRVMVQGPEVQKVVPVDPSFQGGYEAGKGCMTLAISGPMAYIGFIVVWVFGTMYLAVRNGWYVEEEDPALWVGFLVLVMPFIMAYVLRKPIRKVMPVIMGSFVLIILSIPALILTFWVVGEILSFFF